MLRIDSSRSLFLAPLAVLAIAWAPGLATAADPGGQEKIRIKDYDLTKHDDVVKLYRKIGEAASTACGGESLTGSLLPSPDYQACVKQAVAGVVAKVHNEQLSAYHQQVTKDPKLAGHGGLGGTTGKVDAGSN